MYVYRTLVNVKEISHIKFSAIFENSVSCGLYNLWGFFRCQIILWWAFCHLATCKSDIFNIINISVNFFERQYFLTSVSSNLHLKFEQITNNYIVFSESVVFFRIKIQIL